MVKVIGSKGKLVRVEVLGIGEVIRRLRSMGIDITNKVDLAVVKEGTKVQEELQLSIAGKKAEPQSVETGLLANDIVVDKIGKGVVKIGAGGKRYPNSAVTTKDTLTIMEFGTDRGITRRRHVRNTVSREKSKVADNVKIAVKKVTRRF